MKHKFLFHRLRFPVALISVLLFLVLLSSAWAEAPMVKTQAPGYYRMMLGQFEVTALYDGSTEQDMKLLRNISETEIQALRTRMFFSGATTRTSVNAYLINTGSKLVLVDTGLGSIFSPRIGNMMQNLKAAGYNPAQVDAVMITHMHGDHIGGLGDATGKPAFSKAVVYVAKAESDYWLSAAEAEKAPENFRKYFKMVHGIADPYIALGRWKTFANNDVLIPGFKAVPTPGHTPGHTAFEVGTGAESLLIMGDLVHNLAVQFSRPDVSIEYDTDQPQAVSVRQAMFKRAADRRELVAGMHLPFPGIGHIRCDGITTYSWVPIQY
ncbi:MAG: MBL fold metallo-hydrolase [Deltaproteobacteria bacterium]|nr:MBL fold metallo-hydrolase [Deltaproteobacteria bacterium]